ncbi:MAG: hypothetical protein IPH80_03655 [Myxococcales bacterium]|nr:hypothetical protein [Myxococcales bacterium]
MTLDGETSRCTIASGTSSGAPFLVRVVQPGRGARHDGQDEVQRHRPLLRDAAAKQRARRLAVDVLHREEVGVDHPADVEDLRDVRMVELGGEARLVQEHGHELGIARVVRHDALQHDVAFEARQAHDPREVQLGHAAAGEVPEQLVTRRAVVEVGASRRGHLYSIRVESKLSRRALSATTATPILGAAGDAHPSNDGPRR